MSEQNNSDAQNIFKAQMDEVREILKKEGFFCSTLIESELQNFYEVLGIPHHYFREFSADKIAKHIQSLEASRILARTSGHNLDINLKQEDEDSAMFGTRSYVTDADGKVRRREATDIAGPISKIETQIEIRYLSGGIGNDSSDGASSGISNMLKAAIPSDSLSFQMPAHSSQNTVFRLQAFRSRGVLATENVHLRLYFLKRPTFVNPKPKQGETDLNQLGDKDFLSMAPGPIRDAYQSVMTEAVDCLSPVVRVHENILATPEGEGEYMVMVAHRVGSTHSYFTGIPDVYRYYYFYATRKYVEPFSNGVVIFVFFLRSIDEIIENDGTMVKPAEPIDIRLRHVADGISLHYVLPRTSLTPLLRAGEFNAQQVAYAYAAWKFAYHFLNRNSSEFQQLAKTLSANPEGLSMLAKLRKALKTQSFTEGAILTSLYDNKEAIRRMFEDFVCRHMPDCQVPTLRRRRRESEAVAKLCEPFSDKDAQAWIRRNCNTDFDRTIFTAFYEFNKNILKTNFFKPGKIALSFRLDPAFLSDDYGEKPFGVFFIVGSEFRGFHVRFHDVARGGIRLVRSRFSQDYAQNLATVFDECYNLSNTQQRKNKDIPEGGSKGIILLHHAHQDKGTVAFQKFIDSLLDLLLPSDCIVDHLEKKEILFLGPDEGTADLMDWAHLHAKKRGYEYWKAFTTGKSVQYGGIPHDKYGMTTCSVRAYVEGIQDKLALKGEDCFKVQTGGPDGDLGSNEIKMGKEKTLAVIDGSGVLYDPHGINADELRRLATERVMIKMFDTPIPDDGFRVLVETSDITLKDGTLIESGTTFRNNFHFSPLLRAEFFVPCGGRPAAVDGSNVNEFIYGTGVEPGTKPPRFKYVVEGANLFFTQDARLVLEKAGMIVFKDASANKGGVTSSSLEVMAALALTDDEFKQHMAVLDPKNEPPFYTKYVAEVQKKISENANLEFNCLWKEREATGKPLSVLSDKLSVKITKLSAAIETSDGLWANEELRNKVLKRAIPQILQETVGYEEVIKRLPENYKRALFASYVASRFIYEHGLTTPEFAFYEWVNTN